MCYFLNTLSQSFLPQQVLRQKQALFRYWPTNNFIWYGQSWTNYVKMSSDQLLTKVKEYYIGINSINIHDFFSLFISNIISNIIICRHSTQIGWMSIWSALMFEPNAGVLLDILASRSTTSWKLKISFVGKIYNKRWHT